jgi:tetratricopeptide (TPR) repeat protein
MPDHSLRRILILLIVLACCIAAVAQTPAAQARKAPAASPVPSASPTQNPLERIATLQQTVKDNPNDKEVREELGVLLVENGKPGEGRDQLENAVRLGANDPQVWFFIGAANRELGDMPDALSAFQKAEIADPGNGAILSSLCDAYLALNRLDDAQKVANRAITLHPTDSFGYLAMGTVLLDKGQYDEGRKYVQKALAIDPKDARAHLILGRSYMSDKKPNPDLAVEQFDIVLAQDPKDVDALHGKAEALAQKNDIAGAVAVLQQVVKMRPDAVEPEDDIAELYLSKHMDDQARQQFALASKDHPKATEPYVLQAEYDQQQKRYQQSAAEFEQALAIAPDDPRILFEYGRLQLAYLKNPAKAIDTFNKVLAKNPNDPDALFMLGQAYGVEGKWTDARDNFRKSFDITHSYMSLFNLGVAFYTLKDYRAARDAFAALATHQEPGHPDAQIWFVLGDAERMLGDKQNAVAAYKNFLAIVPTGDAAAKARTYIKQLSH